jgi:hypothetical protein
LLAGAEQLNGLAAMVITAAAAAVAAAAAAARRLLQVRRQVHHRRHGLPHCGLQLRLPQGAQGLQVLLLYYKNSCSSYYTAQLCDQYGYNCTDISGAKPGYYHPLTGLCGKYTVKVQTGGRGRSVGRSVGCGQHCWMCAVGGQSRMRHFTCKGL